MIIKSVRRNAVPIPQRYRSYEKLYQAMKDLLHSTSDDYIQVEFANKVQTQNALTCARAYNKKHLNSRLEAFKRGETLYVGRIE